MNHYKLRLKQKIDDARSEGEDNCDCDDASCEYCTEYYGLVEHKNEVDREIKGEDY